MTPTESSAILRASLSNRAVRVWLVACLVLSSAVPVVAQVSETDARIEEVTYSGNGNVTIAGSELHLWQSASHQFTAVISTNSGLDAELCLVTGPAGTERELACVPTTIPANTTETVAVSINPWPANLTGSQEVGVLLRSSNASEPIARETLSFTVIRKDGDLDDDGLTNRREASLGTGLRTPDTDDDGLSDTQEVRTHGTSPTNVDTDGDGLSDREEIDTHQTDPTKADTDGDELPDPRELELGTNPNKADSDGDGIDDGSEVNVHDTAPTNPDTDDDGLDDGAEINDHETNPLRADTDGDGLNDNLEVNTFGTDPNGIDTDGDGLEDGAEANEFQTDPVKADSDDDGLTDGQEVNTYDTNPTNPDTDGDGLQDGAEVNQHGTNPNKIDTDNDGQSDRVEVTGGVPPYLTMPAVVLGGLLLLAIAVGGLLHRSGRIGVPLRRWLQVAASELASHLGGDGAPTDEADGRSTEEVPPEFLSNEDRILTLLDDHEGQMRQTDIVEETGWSKSKVSRVLAEMEEDEQIVKIDVGKGNIVTRPDELPPGARSPFDK